jgi:hypothetical protein
VADVTQGNETFCTDWNTLMWRNATKHFALSETRLGSMQKHICFVLPLFEAVIYINIW